jgi:hypothetical protein
MRSEAPVTMYCTEAEVVGVRSEIEEDEAG